MNKAEKFVGEFLSFYNNAHIYPDVVFNIELDKLYSKAAYINRHKIKEEYVKAVKKAKTLQVKKEKVIPTPDIKTFKKRNGKK